MKLLLLLLFISVSLYAKELKVDDCVGAPIPTKEKKINLCVAKYTSKTGKVISDLDIDILIGKTKERFESTLINIIDKERIVVEGVENIDPQTNQEYIDLMILTKSKFEDCDIIVGVVDKLTNGVGMVGTPFDYYYDYDESYANVIILENKTIYLPHYIGLALGLLVTYEKKQLDDNDMCSDTAFDPYNENGSSDNSCNWELSCDSKCRYDCDDKGMNCKEATPPTHNIMSYYFICNQKLHPDNFTQEQINRMHCFAKKMFFCDNDDECEESEMCSTENRCIEFECKNECTYGDSPICKDKDIAVCRVDSHGCYKLKSIKTCNNDCKDGLCVEKKEDKKSKDASSCNYSNKNNSFFLFYFLLLVMYIKKINYRK